MKTKVWVIALLAIMGVLALWGGMKAVGIIILATLAVLLVLALMGILVPATSRYARWYENNSECLVSIAIVLFFVSIIFF